MKQTRNTNNRANRFADMILEDIMRKIKGNKSNIQLNESIGYDDYASISDALAECGWAFTDSYDVRNRNTGQQGIRYIIEPYPDNPDGIKPFDVEQMKRKMTQFIGQDNVIFSEGQHRYAPENKNLSMVVLDNTYDTLYESANVRYKGFKCVNTSNDPSFPTYSIVSPDGETIGNTLFPSEMKEIVDDYINGNL